MYQTDQDLFDDGTNKKTSAYSLGHAAEVKLL